MIKWSRAPDSGRRVRLGFELCRQLRRRRQRHRTRGGGRLRGDGGCAGRRGGRLLHRQRTRVAQYRLLHRSHRRRAGARFLLYEVSSGGTLVSPPNQFGYLDFDCPMVLPTVNMSLEVTINGVQVIAMYATGSFYPTSLAYQLSINVGLQTPDGSSQFSIPLLGVFGTLGTQHSAGYTITIGTDVYVSFSRHDYTQDVAGTFDVYFQAYKGYPDIEWEATAELIGTSSSSISGPVIFMFPTGSLEVVACLSGSYQNINASRPTLQCAGSELELHQDLSNSEFQGIERAYDALRLMLDTLDGIVQIGFGILTSSVG